MTTKIKTTGKSLLELRDKYPQHFYVTEDAWYEKEAFASEKPPAGEYEFDFDTRLTNLSSDEQKANLPQGFEVPHAATLVEAMIVHFEATGERVFKDCFASTKCRTSAGRLPVVGDFDGSGLDVDGWDGSRSSRVGCGASRKLRGFETPESLTARVEKLEAIIKHHNLTV